MAGSWRIGEVARLTGLTTRTLRHYDQLGLLVPSARSWGDYRLYDEGDLVRLLQIQNLKALGMGLAEIAEALADPGLDASTTLRRHLEHLRQRIADEQALAAQLDRLQRQAPLDWREVLAAIAATQRLGHPDPAVRLRTALSPDAGGTSDLLDALVAETEPGVADALIWSLAGRPEALAGAVERLPKASRQARASLLRLLGKTRDPLAVGAILGHLGDPATRRTAVEALSRIGSTEAMAALLDCLGEDDTSLTESLAGFGSSAVPDLVGSLSSGRAEVRTQAAEILGRIGDPLAAPALSAAVADEDQEVSLAALVALADLGDPGTAEIERLRPGLQQPLAAVADRLLTAL